MPADANYLRDQLFFGSLSLAICLAIVGALVKTYGPDWDNKNAGNAAVFFLYLYIAVSIASITKKGP